MLEDDTTALLGESVEVKSGSSNGAPKRLVLDEALVYFNKL